MAIEEVKRSPDTGGIPDAPGIYAWWMNRDAIPGVPFVPHPLVADVGLLYVGVSPRDARSSQKLRGRVVNNHIGGNIGSSTFRFVLASLLMDELSLKPFRTKTKVVLSAADNSLLRDWQSHHVGLTWCEREAPWEIEGGVIRAMKPPLNSRDNELHEFHARVTASRASLRAAASAAGGV